MRVLDSQVALKRDRRSHVSDWLGKRMKRGEEIAKKSGMIGEKNSLQYFSVDFEPKC
jgi:hypothetical protein